MLQGILVFASVMATLGLQVVLESIRSLLSHVCVLTSLPSMLYCFFYLHAFVISKKGALRKVVQFRRVLIFNAGLWKEIQDFVQTEYGV